MFATQGLRLGFVLAVSTAFAANAFAQTAAQPFAPNRSGGAAASGFRAPGTLTAAKGPAAPPATTVGGAAGARLPVRLVQDTGGGRQNSPPQYEAGDGIRPVSTAARRPIAKVTSGSGALPHDAGQVWKEYDISPYTARVTTTNRPEQAVVDWILRETGYEVWHSDPVGFMTANNRTLKVFHTPQMHEVISELVDRFVNPEAENQAFSLRVITIDNPNWRAPALKMLKPVDVQTQGVQAWLVQKEDAALLLAEARKRSDFREHSSPHLLVNNGQSTVVSATRPTSYVRDVIQRPNVWPGFETESAQIDEGFTIELNPLLSLDGGSVDAILKCHIDQVERLREVMLEVPNPAAPRQRTKIEVPQISHCRVHERFRWPSNMVLLVGLGVVATPVPTVATTPNILTALAMPQSPPRADLLVIVESKGAAGQAPATAMRTGRVDNSSYRGRY